MATRRPILSTLIAVLLFAAGAAPATAAPARGDLLEERIINGYAPTQAWPAQTSVRFVTTSGTYVCGGTLVSARWVLTAGHCATNDDGTVLTAGAFSLRVGSTSRSSGGTTALVDAVVRHPDYSDSGAPSNDVTLLHLAAAVPQEPLELVAAGDTSLWSAGTDATIIGWGVTESGSTSATLREAQVTMASDGSCAGLWGTSFSELSMVCAGGSTTDTCSGDSGGPLMVPHQGTFVLAGVTSWGSYPCGDPEYPGVYARVGASAMSSWLRGHFPTAGITATPPTPVAGELLTLNASLSPGSQTAAPVLAWDLDDDGVFDDAAGSSATMTFPTAGTPVVRVQATYPDGDRAVARRRLSVPEAVVVPPPSVTPPPAPPPPPPPPAPPATTQPIQQIQQVLQPPAGDAAIGTVKAPARMKLSTLRSKGLRVRVTCERACDISGRLRRGDTTLGRAGGSLDAGESRIVTVRLGARARRSLRGHRRVTLRLTTQLRSGADSAQISRRVVASV